MMVDGPIHFWFGLSYASWLVLPRAAMQEMPEDWQERMVALIDELEERFPDWNDGVSFYVNAKKDGKFCKMPEGLCDYRRGTKFKSPLTPTPNKVE